MQGKNKFDLLDLADELGTDEEGLGMESGRRDIIYSALVEDIVRDNRSSQTMKKWFFGIVCSVFAVVCILGMVSIIIIACKADIQLPDIGIAFTAFGGVIGSIIVLPQIIAKHLFPENSESVRFSFIKQNQDFDSSPYLSYYNGGQDTTVKETIE